MNGKGYVVTYDNGTGYYEWASTPCETPEQAYAAAGVQPGESMGSYDCRLEQVVGQGLSQPIEDHPDFCLACHHASGYCGVCTGAYWNHKGWHNTFGAWMPKEN